ncbi:MAG: TIGR04282 family arsenosugar biosynthesis glycosyltransferase [Rubrivivax sp.]|nr:TIGR04282 family arsenosugar biosynthesis glycosyltransferase [Rubrivivax sp.]
MNCALIVFAKAPVAGLAKTRLAPALGAAGAAAVAARLLDRAVRAAVDAGVGPVELCTAPDTAHPAFQRLQRELGVTLTTQGDGDLGRRMNRALTRALQAHDRVLLTGTDAPALDAARLREAAIALTTADAVFVPALDGGYALVGLARPAPALFDGVPWSTSQVMAATRERALAAGLRWTELAPVADVDEPADLAHLPAGWLGGLGGAGDADPGAAPP